ncbi:MAG: RNA polymerase sigma factor [Roseibacillus sp.]
MSPILELLASEQRSFPALNNDIDTSATLLLRLRDKADQASWNEFVEIYTPLLFAYCQKRAIAPQDSADIVQNVFLSVSKALKTFQYDPAKGRFKAWLFTVLRNAINGHFRKASRTPDTTSEPFLLEQAQDEDLEMDWDRDYRLRLLRWAMDKIEPEFTPRSWSIFYKTAIEDQSPDQVAQELGMNKNAVTVQKYRVVQRLRQKLQSIDAARWEEDLVAEKGAQG